MDARIDAEEAPGGGAPGPDAAFTLRASDGAPVATATCVLWGSLAWMRVPAACPPEAERALARRIAAFAEERGAASLGVDVPPERAAAYEAEGFAPVWGESALWTRATTPRARDAPPRGAWAIYPVSTAETMELLQYDAPRSGAGRGRHLAALMAERPHQAFVAVSRASGAFEGHAFAHAHGIGPLMADAPEAAAALLRAVESAGAAPRAIVPAWNPAAERVFRDAGYSSTGERRVRMVRGDALRGRAETWYAIGALG